MCSWVAGAKPSGGASLAWRPVSPEQRCVREGPGGQAGDESRGLEPGILTPLRVKPDWEALQEVTPVTREPWQPGPGGGGARGLMLGVSGDGFAERRKYSYGCQRDKGWRDKLGDWDCHKHTSIHKIDT